jgi:hypothetical protein
LGVCLVAILASVVALYNTAGLTSPAPLGKGEPMSPEARERSFDELARGLASGSVSRRRALRLMGAALVGGTLASLGIAEAAADPPGCKRAGKHCTRGTQCCSGNCANGTCAAACPSGRVLLSNGTCAIPCTTAPECTGGCECIRSSVDAFQGFCTTLILGGGCATDAECPTGQFCARVSGVNVCTQAC